MAENRAFDTRSGVMERLSEKPSFVGCRRQAGSISALHDNERATALRASHDRAGGRPTAISSAARAGSEANDALTYQLDPSQEADHLRSLTISVSPYVGKIATGS